MAAGPADNSTSVEVKSDNELVALVQKLLAENGYDPGPPDGLLGEKTIEAISEFQGKARPAEDRPDRHRARRGAAEPLDLSRIGAAGQAARLVIAI